MLYAHMSKRKYVSFTQFYEIRDQLGNDFDVNDPDTKKMLNTLKQNLNDTSDDETFFMTLCVRNPGIQENLLKYCIDNGADLNAKNLHGETPFSWICYHSNNLTFDTLKYCVEKGGAVFTSSAFLRLCEKFNGLTVEVLTYCINHGADINASNLNQNVFYKAAANKNGISDDVIYFFTQNGCDINGPYDKIYMCHRSPFINLAKNGYLSFDTFRILVIAGADMNLENEDGLSAFYCMIEKIDLHLLRMFLIFCFNNGGLVNGNYTNKSRNPFVKIMQKSNDKFDDFKFCIKHGGDMNHQDRYEGNPLYVLCDYIRWEDITTAQQVIYYCIINEGNMIDRPPCRYSPLEIIQQRSKPLYDYAVNLLKIRSAS